MCYVLTPANTSARLDLKVKTRNPKTIEHTGRYFVFTIYNLFSL
jgi:hypothetical protein